MESTLYGIYALLIFVSVIQTVSTANEWSILRKTFWILSKRKISFLKKTKKVTEKNQRAIFYFILLDSPIIGGVTATAWRQLLQARNCPSPCER